MRFLSWLNCCCSAHPPSTYIRANSSSGTLFFPQDDVVDFNKLLQTPLPPVPRDVTFSAHWLAIEGVQPAIPQNPSIKKNAQVAAMRKKKFNPLVKPIVAHVLSVELQRYFEEVTLSVLGSDENKIALAVGSVQADPGLNDLLPYFAQFVAEEVTKNLRNLPVLRNLMRFCGGLLSSEHMHLEPYLHQLLPSILTCLVGKSLCADPSVEDHWALRDLAAELIEKIVRSFGSAFVTLQPRLAKTLIGALLDFAKPLTTHYGALKGINALGR
jgi:transcription initiation factor TFIID subunit 6